MESLNKENEQNVSDHINDNIIQKIIPLCTPEKRYPLLSEESIMKTPNKIVSNNLPRLFK